MKVEIEIARARLAEVMSSAIEGGDPVTRSWVLQAVCFGTEKYA